LALDSLAEVAALWWTRGSELESRGLGLRLRGLWAWPLKIFSKQKSAMHSASEQLNAVLDARQAGPSDYPDLPDAQREHHLTMQLEGELMPCRPALTAAKKSV
jgi:hypothetical protein